jgi:hypothetical protein
LQCCEQHCELCVHVLPSVRHVAFKGAHAPDAHVPLQHWVLAVHDPPSETHAGNAHTPLVHWPVQHWPANEQALPTLRQLGGGPDPPPVPHLLKPPPPQYWGDAHMPHCNRPPQPSPAGPQSKPSCAHVRGVHWMPPSGASPLLPPQMLKPPPPQYWGLVQLPHWRIPPQPSPAAPQVKPSCGHVLGTQKETEPPSAAPHLKKPPAPHVWPAGQAPQSSKPPQPSAPGPHW